MKLWIKSQDNHLTNFKENDIKCEQNRFYKPGHESYADGSYRVSNKRKRAFDICSDKTKWEDYKELYIIKQQLLADYELLQKDPEEKDARHQTDEQIEKLEQQVQAHRVKEAKLRDYLKGLEKDSLKDLSEFEPKYIFESIIFALNEILNEGSDGNE